MLGSCDRGDVNRIKANAVFELGACCSNMELIDHEPVFSEIVGYSETILGAVNLDDFDLELENGDSLLIEFIFSEESFICPFNTICNRHNGIPVELISIEKL